MPSLSTLTANLAWSFTFCNVAFVAQFMQRLFNNIYIYISWLACLGILMEKICNSISPNHMKEGTLHKVKVIENNLSMGSREQMKSIVREN
jgi:hypothetical protein